MKNSKVAAFAISAIAFLALVAGTSYAYFQAVVTGTGNTNTIKSGSMQIKFTDGDAISVENIEPGISVSKTFTVENTGSLDATFNVSLTSTSATNNFTTGNLIVYLEDITNASSPTTIVAESTKKSVPTGTSTTQLASSISIATGVTKTYKLYIKLFNDTSTNQVADMGKAFSGKISVTGEGA